MANIYLKAICLGIVAGSRSMSAPALVSNRFARTQPASIATSPFAWLASSKTAAILKLMAAGELGGDKLPMTPSRLAPGPLVFRALSGGLCGAALCEAEGGEIALGAIAGSFAAVASAFAFYHFRKSAGETTGLPDSVFAVMEDGIALGLGWKALAE